MGSSAAQLQMNSTLKSDAGDSSRQFYRIAIWAIGAAALVYLIVEHQPHLFQWLPYLIILACPLMHLFMHRGHRHQSRHDDHGQHKH